MANVKMISRKLSWLALFIALSAVGASIKVPAIVGSVAFDAFPALLAGAILGGGAGVTVGLLGHLLSALLSGFPLGPLHILIGLEMAALVYMFTVLFKNNHRVSAGILFILGNTFAAPLPFIFLMDMGFYLAMVPSLLVGSMFNTVLSLIAIPRLTALFKQKNLNREVKM